VSIIEDNGMRWWRERERRKREAEMATYAERTERMRVAIDAGDWRKVRLILCEGGGHAWRGQAGNARCADCGKAESDNA
jgi:hypothetical protein